MKIVIFFICGILLAQTPTTQDAIQLTQLQLIQVLEIQRAQYQAARDDERAHAEMLEAEKRMIAAHEQLLSYNAAMEKLQNEFRRTYKCEDCIIVAPGAGFVRSTDIQFIRPKTTSSTAH